MKLFLVCIAFCGAIAAGAVSEDGKYKLLEGIKTCNENDPNLNECIKNAIQDLIPKLHKGNKELGAPAIDPFLVPNDRYVYNNGAIQGSAEIKGVKIYGISSVQIKKVDTKISDTGLTSEIEIFLPRLYTEGRYKADVKINDIKMNPRGFFNNTISKTTVITKVSGTFETIKGVKYLRLTSFDFVPEIGDMKIYTDGLYPEPQLNAVALNFVNQYWPEVYKLVVSETRVYWEPILLDNFNKFFLTIPLDTLVLTKNAK